MERGTYTGIVGWEEGHTLVLLDGKRDTHRYCWMERGTHTGIVGGKDGHTQVLLEGKRDTWREYLGRGKEEDWEDFQFIVQ